MARAAWANRDNLGYAWRILNHGVCDGCSLGPYGLKDNVISGTHLCMTRLNLLRLNTMPPAAVRRNLDPHVDGVTLPAAYRVKVLNHELRCVFQGHCLPFSQNLRNLLSE